MTIDLGIIFPSFSWLPTLTPQVHPIHIQMLLLQPLNDSGDYVAACRPKHKYASVKKQILLPSSTRAHISQPKLIHKKIKWLGTYTQPHKRVLVCKNLNTLPPTTCQEAEAALSEARSSITLPPTTRQETARTAPYRRRFSFWLHLNYIANHGIYIYIYRYIYIYIYISICHAVKHI